MKFGFKRPLGMTVSDREYNFKSSANHAYGWGCPRTAVGRKRQYACQEGLVPLCIVEQLYKTHKTACLEMAEPAKSSHIL